MAVGGNAQLIQMNEKE